MNLIYKFLFFFINIIPEFMFVFLLKILNIFIRKYKNPKVVKKGVKNENANDLIIIDIMHSIGDFLISLHTLSQLDIGNKKYYVLAHESQKSIIEKINFANMIFIYNTNALASHYNNVTTSLKEMKIKINYLENLIANYTIGNVYIYGYSITLEHLIILSKVKYNQLFVLNLFNKKKKFRVCQIAPSKFLWSKYYSNIYKYNLVLTKPKYLIAYKEMYSLITNHTKDFDPINLSWLFDNEKNFSFACMPFTSTNRKDLDLKILKDIFDISFKKFPNLKINVYGKWTKKEFEKWETVFDSNYQYIKNLNIKVNQFNNLYELMKDINKNIFSITNDTSLYHFSNLLNIRTFLFFNNSICDKENNIFVNYWTPYNKRENFINLLNNNFFV